MKNEPGTKEVEWEVLPPEEKRKRAQVEPVFRWAALIMDGLMRIPGTNRRFGLNPIIDLIPGIGDVSAAFVSGSVLVYALRHGIPKMLLARMATNVLINEIVGIIPGIGSAFAFWFRCNKRNHDLLMQHASAPAVSRPSDRYFVVGVLVLLVAIVGAGMLLSVFLLREFLRLLGAH